MPGDTRLNVTVTIIDDTDFEGAEQFLGRLTTSTNAIIVLAVTAVTIHDNDRKYPLYNLCNSIIQYCK